MKRTYQLVEIEKYEAIPEKPGMVRHVGNVTYGELEQGIQAELKKHHADILDTMDSIPHLIHWESKPTEEIPSYRRIYAYAVYGGSEGIYLHVDIDLQGAPSKTIMLGKTLQTSDEAMFDMFKLAAAITMMVCG
jgi:hypothetical protein